MGNNIGKIRHNINVYWNLITYTILKYSWVVKSRKSTIHGDVLMFHNVSDDEMQPFTCSIEKFEQVILKYKRDGYQIISIDSMFKLITDGKKIPFAVITFDDISDSVYKNAYPILKKHKIPFAIFVTTSFVGKEGYLSDSQLKIFSEDPLCTIGAHTLTHPMLKKVQNAEEEIFKSKIILENKIGRKVHYFAYPYGRRTSVSKRIEELAKNAGFKAAFGTIGVSISDYTIKQKFYLPRIVGEKIEITEVD